MRRRRATPLLRDIVAETSLNTSQLVYPLFVSEASGSPEPIESMPGVHRYPIEKLVDEVGRALGLGIRSFLLFGIPASKDAVGSGAYSREGVIQQALRRMREAFGKDVLLIADTCMCEYTSHGHCGYLSGNTVDNDKSLELLSKTAVSQAEAGADLVAPSAMMDHQVRAIRRALDSEDFMDTLIMSYSAKYASCFYGPFRTAADSAPSFGDRRSYQMDPRNGNEALDEIASDIEEGADIVMVKPALPYLDVIREASKAFTQPLAAYQVSGEYTMIRAAAAKGFLDEKLAVLETVGAIRRAGARIIITYFAPAIAEWLAS